jgi:hypothetical protein
MRKANTNAPGARYGNQRDGSASTAMCQAGFNRGVSTASTNSTERSVSYVTPIRETTSRFVPFSCEWQCSKSLTGFGTVSANDECGKTNYFPPELTGNETYVE